MFRANELLENLTKVLSPFQVLNKTFRLKKTFFFEAISFV